MTTYTEKILKDITEVMTPSEIEEYFNNKCYLSKSEFGELINNLIVSFSNDTLKTVFSSKKFKEFSDCTNEYGEPMVHAILYAVKAICESDEIDEIHKLHFKESMINILLDEAFPFQWRMTDYYEANNPFHIISAMTDWLTVDELNKFIDKLLSNGINPLNRNYEEKTAIEILMESSLDETEKNKIISNLAQESDKFIIEISENCYD